MQTNNFGFQQVAKYREQFSSKSLPELISIFNKEVGSHAWTSQKSYFLRALFDEIASRDIDISAIKKGNNISFAKHVAIDGNALVTID